MGVVGGGQTNRNNKQYNMEGRGFMYMAVAVVCCVGVGRGTNQQTKSMGRDLIMSHHIYIYIYIYTCHAKRVKWSIADVCSHQDRVVMKVIIEMLASVADRSIGRGLSMSISVRTRKMVNYACDVWGRNKFSPVGCNSIFEFVPKIIIF